MDVACFHYSMFTYAAFLNMNSSDKNLEKVNLDIGYCNLESEKSKINGFHAFLSVKDNNRYLVYETIPENKECIKTTYTSHIRFNSNDSSNLVFGNKFEAKMLYLSLIGDTF